MSRWPIVIILSLVAFAVYLGVQASSWEPPTYSAPSPPASNLPSTAKSNIVGSGGSSSSSNPISRSTPASRLASIDSGNLVNPSDPLAIRYQAQLDALSSIGEPGHENGYSDMALLCQKTELKHGVEESNLSILEAVNTSCPHDVSQGEHITDLFASYVVLRDKGMSRELAISQLHGLIESIAHPGQ